MTSRSKDPAHDNLQRTIMRLIRENHASGAILMLQREERMEVFSALSGANSLDRNVRAELAERLHEAANAVADGDGMELGPPGGAPIEASDPRHPFHDLWRKQTARAPGEPGPKPAAPLPAPIKSLMDALRDVLFQHRDNKSLSREDVLKCIIVTANAYAVAIVGRSIEEAAATVVKAATAYQQIVRENPIHWPPPA